MRTPWVPLGEVLQMKRTPVVLAEGESYRRIGIYSWGKGMLHRDAVPASEMGSMKYFTFPNPSLVFSNIQAWEGAVALAGDAEAGFVSSSRFYPYVNASGWDVSLRFLLEFFRSEQGVAVMRAASPGTQVRNKVLGRAALEASLIPLPPRAEQERTVAHLTAIESRVVRSRASSPTLPAALLVSQWLESLPMRRLGIVAQINPRPVKVTPQTPIDFVPMEAVDARTGTIASPIPRLRGELSSGYRQFLRGDVIFARITPSMQNGKSAIYRGNQAAVGYGSTEFHILRPHEAAHAEWVWAVLRTRWFIEQAKLAFTGTAGQQRVPSGFLEQVEIPVPEPDQLASATRRLTGLRERINVLEMLGGHRASLSAALLPAARNEIFNAMR